MRRFLVVALALVCLLAPLPGVRLPAADSAGANFLRVSGRLAGSEKVIFAGDRTCNDLWNDCDFPAVRVTNRYLHIVLHDSPANADWQVQAGSYCRDGLPDIAGGEPLPASGLLEVVVDLGSDAAALEGSSSCFIFRGRNHWAVTFFAAYLDDNAAADVDEVYPGYQTQYGRPAGPDIDVTYIHRTPSYPYDAVKNQPAPGDPVIFEAHVRNAGSVDAPPFVYRWLLDGKPVLTGVATGGLAAGAENVFQFPWKWRPEPHVLEFRVIPAGVELSRTNDRLSIRTNALSLGFWVEQSAWEYFNRYQWLYCSALSCSGSDSFADWLQREVAAWNTLLASAIYPGLAPNGVVDRIRVDKITVVPDGSLPLHGGRPTNSPDQSDRSVDLQWGLPTDGVGKAYPHQWDGPFNLDWALIHELGHARSLADMYRFDVSAGTDTEIDIKDAAGQSIYDSQDPLSPESRLHAFFTAQNEVLLYQDAAHDLMDCTCDQYYSAYTALVLNRIQGRRPICGNFNPPCNLGDWFLDLPPDNRIRLIGPGGRPLANGTKVRVFYDQSTSYTGHVFTESDEETLRVQSGSIELGSDPFRVEGDRYLAGHNLVLLEIDPNGLDQFCFAEPTTFNVAYWLGYSTSAHPATYLLRVDRIKANSCELAHPPPLVNEPFGTSPFQSRVTIRTSVVGHARPSRLVDVQLRDAGIPARPMRNRLVRFTNGAGVVVAQGTTNSSGDVQVRIPNRGPIRLVDMTDDGLIIPMGSADPALPADRR